MSRAASSNNEGFRNFHTIFSVMVQYYYLSGWEQFIAVITDMLSKIIKSVCVFIVNYQQNREIFILTRNTVDGEVEGNVTCVVGNLLLVYFVLLKIFISCSPPEKLVFIE